MHFGRIESIQGINFELPPDPVRTDKFLSLPRQSTTKTYVGGPIWSCREWLGSVYPKGTKQTEFLKIYATQFKTVEVSSLFYHLVEPARISLWRDQTTPDFRFCPKVYRGITENLSSFQMPQLVRRYCDSLVAFRDRLGLVLAQFSETFSPMQQESLVKFLKVWPREFPLAIELRHPAWFQGPTLRDETVDLFYRNRIASVITDTPGRRDVLHFSLTQPKVLIRFQGNSGHATDEERILDWDKRLKKWSQHSLEEIYFFTHQPEDRWIPTTAFFALKTLSGESAMGGRLGQMEML